ncbi:MAG: hypothetical protein H0T89_02065 [Deltaproteobacteria bacterium]|nr:hypothetical protein [Deltaproteobacteria bacterium]MDQ3298002.1 hypothetical protein [Myxococcota bacterium]
MKLMLMVWLVAMLGCGASNAEVRTAKSATYTVAPQTLFDTALQVTQKTYKLGEIDAANGRFATESQVYSAEGGRQSPGAGGFVNMSDGSIMLSLFVEIVAIDDTHHAVVVTPKTFQVLTGSPKPRELAPDDPNLPPWVTGRVDSLAVAIHEQAKQHAVAR